MTDDPVKEDAPPPPSEQVHLPGPSYLPVAVALGTSIALAGVIYSWFLFAAGALLVLIAALRWVRETREEMAQLPLEH